MLCISYYEAFQRKKRANSWNDCHSWIECLDSKSAIKNLLGFHACNFQHVSLASGRAVFSACGPDPSKAKKRLSSPTTHYPATSNQEPGPLSSWGYYGDTGDRAGARGRGGITMAQTQNPKTKHLVLDQRMFLWGSHVLGQDIDEVWWPTDLDQWISGSQWWKVLPRRSRGQTRTTRGDSDPPQGQLARPVLLPVC
jgi:hypothetical protein